MTTKSLTKLQESAGLQREKPSLWRCKSFQSVIVLALWADSVGQARIPQPMPFSQTYPMCCINIRNFVDQFYQFTDGVAQQHLDVDEVLRRVSFFFYSTHDRFLIQIQSLDGLLSDHVSKQIAKKLQTMLNLSQIAQVVINLEHFCTACNELESVLMNLR